jgi:hypothetical protein
MNSKLQLRGIMIGRKENRPIKRDVKPGSKKQLSQYTKNRIKFTVHLKSQRFFRPMATR